MTERDRVLDALGERLAAARRGYPLRVGIDGICGSGKTIFARDLVSVLTARGIPTIHLDSDGFHHVRAVRQRKLADEARGYYENAYDFDALAERVLVPLGPGGSGTYATEVHDLATDAVIEDRTAQADPRSVVVFACTFIQRGGLRDLWDEVVYLDTARDVALRRGVERDADALGGSKAAEATYERRYMAACDLYLAHERPVERASLVIAHDDPGAPRILRDFVS